MSHGLIIRRRRSPQPAGAHMLTRVSDRRTADQTPRSFDAVVVGSGATGGWAAKELTEAGLTVALLEAGPEVSGDGPGAVAASNPSARQQIQARCGAFYDGNAHLFVDDVDNPYSTPDDEPFEWIRSRVVGGRMHLWGRMALRMSERELKAASHDGEGVDWPISYADLAPYYDRIERFLEVCGARDGLPQVPDGVYTKSPRFSTGELEFKRAVESRWDTRRVIGARTVEASPEATIAAARATGRLTLLAGSVVSRVLTDTGDRARGVAFVDCPSGAEREISGQVIMLCASTIESTRLLLNSSGPSHPDGLANASGLLGHYLFDHTFGIRVEGTARRGSRRMRDQTDRGCVVPGFRNVSETGVDFLRSYGVELQINTATTGRLAPVRALLRRPGFWMSAFGEALPRFESRVSLDSVKKDAWGIPIARIACRYGENERRMAVDQVEQLQEMAAAADLEVETVHAELSPPGLSIHEMGTARMGSDPSNSVLNPHNQAWEVRNLFVTDGSCFPSGGFQNPALTLMALTVRACETAVGLLKRGEL